MFLVCVNAKYVCVLAINFVVDILYLFHGHSNFKYILLCFTLLIQNFIKSKRTTRW